VDGNKNRHDCIELLNKSFFEKLLIYWSTRDLCHEEEVLVTILSVAIYFDKEIFPEELEKAREILHERIKGDGHIDILMDKIKLRLYEYTKDYEIYMQDREKAFHFVGDDIQLYRIMRDIFEADGGVKESELMAEELVKKEFDERWKLKEDKYFKAAEKRWKS